MDRQLLLLGMYRKLGRKCILLSRFIDANGLIAADRRHEEQVAYVSWWPRQYIWMNSEYNVGFWTVRQEDWFQQRLATILHHDGQPVSAHDWQKNHLQGDRRAFDAVKKFEALCTRSLSPSS